MLKRTLVIFLAFPLAANLEAQGNAVDSPMGTRWGHEVGSERVWCEHPRPQLQREGWVNLNGMWDLESSSKDETQNPKWWSKDEGTVNITSPLRKILVPFAPESLLSGVGRPLEPDQALWYRRDLPVKPESGKRTILHFDAVDYEAVVWVNGKGAGRHIGGFTPFAFDITERLKESGNQVCVKVLDATGGYQLRGKQSLNPKGITYSRVSGIWQTVWLEQVPERFIQDLAFESSWGTEADGDGARLTVKANLRGAALSGERLRVTSTLDGREAQAEGSGVVTLQIGYCDPVLPDG